MNNVETITKIFFLLSKLRSTETDGTITISHSLVMIKQYDNLNHPKTIVQFLGWFSIYFIKIVFH